MNDTTTKTNQQNDIKAIITDLGHRAKAASRFLATATHEIPVSYTHLTLPTKDGV